MSDLPLTKLSETPKTITLGWTPPAGCRGYIFRANGQKSSTLDPTRDTVRFSKPGPYEVEALGTLSTGAYPTPVVTPPPSPPPAAGNGRGVERLGTSYLKTEDLSACDVLFVDLNALGAPADWPKIPCYRYFSLLSVNRNYLTSVPWAAANTAGVLLKDASGALITNGGYPDNNIGDPGSPVYRQMLLDSIVSALKGSGFVGCELDDTVRDFHGLLSAQSPKYPDVASWETAVVGLVAFVGDGLKAAGFKVVPNATGYTAGDASSNDASLQKEFWGRLAPHVTGLIAEYWNQQPNAKTEVYRTGHDDWSHFWDNWCSLIPLCDSWGIDFFCACVGNPSGPVVEYLRASFLLEWNGSHGYFLTADPDGARVNASQPWAKNMGAPLGAKQAVGVGYRRVFANGKVLVNPHPSAAQTIDGVNLAAGTAKIL